MLRIPHASLFVALALAACQAPAAPVAGVVPDAAAQAEILATIDRLFVAMAARDQQAFAAELFGDGVVHSQIERDGAWQLRSRSLRDLAAGLGNGRERLAETYWQPTVLQRGPLAVVWAPYRFQIDGRDSHYGVDVFELMQVDGRWRITGLAYTVEPGAGAQLAPAPGHEVRPAALR